eukprot:PhF_6_TR7315/c0_g1_i2/m.10961
MSFSVESLLTGATKALQHNITSSNHNSSLLTPCSPNLMELLHALLSAVQSIHLEQQVIQQRVNTLTTLYESLQKEMTPRTEVEALAQGLHDLADILKTTSMSENNPPPPSYPPPEIMEKQIESTVRKYVSGKVTDEVTRAMDSITSQQRRLDAMQLTMDKLNSSVEAMMAMNIQVVGSRKDISPSTLAAVAHRHIPLTPPVNIITSPHQEYHHQYPPQSVAPKLGMEIAENIGGGGGGYHPSSVTTVSVCSVVPGTPAYNAGVRAGDNILEFNGLPIRSRQELLAALRGAGIVSEMIVERAGDT